MNQDRWNRVKAIFGDVLDAEPQDPSVFVRTACGDDEELFEEVMSLLEADSKKTILRNPAFVAGAPRLAGSHPVGPPLQAPPVRTPTSTRESTEPVPARFDPTVEHEYLDEYSRLSIPRARSGLLLGVILYGSFAILDRWVAPDQYLYIWLIRAIVVVSAAIGYAYSFTPRFVRHWQLTVCILVAMGAIGILIMIAIIPVPGSYLYYAGLLLLTIYYGTLIRLSFAYAAGLSGSIFTIYVGLALYTHTPATVTFTNVMMLIGGNVIALLANHTLERHSRRDFWQRRVIEAHARELEERHEALMATNDELVRSREEAMRAAQRNELLFAALTEALPGTVLDDKYRLDAKIGAGGFGTVYRGFHLLLQRPVAVKLLKPTSGTSTTSIAKFRREAIAASLLEHGNAVQVFDFGVAAGTVGYLVMELLEGQPLSDALVAQERFDLLRCGQILDPLCSVLAHAHQRGLIHGDLKPNNVFLHRAGDREVVKIIDFGVARLVGTSGVDLPSMAFTTAVMGTPAYMAPERLAGADYDSRADIYSLGVIAFEMLTGEKPFAYGANWAAALAQGTSAPPSLSARDPRIPPAIGAIVSRALAAHSADRPSAEEFGRVFLGSLSESNEIRAH